MVVTSLEYFFTRFSTERTDIRFLCKERKSALACPSAGVMMLLSSQYERSASRTSSPK